MAEDLFKEMLERYPKDLVETSREKEGVTLKSPAATQVKRQRVDKEPT